jgi:hypothetical protein
MWNQRDPLDRIDPRAVAEAMVLVKQRMRNGPEMMGPSPPGPAGLLGHRPNLSRGGSVSGAEQFGGQTWSSAKSGGGGARPMPARPTTWSEPRDFPARDYAARDFPARDYGARDYEMQDGYGARGSGSMMRPPAYHMQGPPAANPGAPRGAFAAERGGVGGWGEGGGIGGGGGIFRGRSAEMSGVPKKITVADICSSYHSGDFDMVPPKYLTCRDCHVR